MKICKLNFNINNTLPRQNFTRKPFVQGLGNCDSFEKSNDVNFGAQKLYDVNLRRRTTGRKLKAQVFALDSSARDKNLFFNLYLGWGVTQYALPMYQNYHRGGKDKFIAVSLGNEPHPRAGNIQSVVNFKDVRVKGKKECRIIYLQSAPNIADNPKSSVRGAGEVALYAVVKYAKKNKCSRISLLSTNNDFYERIGFKMGVKSHPLSNICEYYLEEKDYNAFLGMIEKKYSFKTL